MSASTAQTTFWVYAALMGVSLSSIFLVYTGGSIDGDWNDRSRDSCLSLAAPNCSLTELRIDSAVACNGGQPRKRVQAAME